MLSAAPHRRKIHPDGDGIFMVPEPGGLYYDTARKGKRDHSASKTMTGPLV